MSRRRIILVSALLACAGLIPPPLCAVAAEEPLTGIEYKLRLATEVLNDGRFEKLLDLIGVKSSDEERTCRIIEFLDVRDALLQESNFIVRHRAELGNGACPLVAPNRAPKGLSTLKYRTRDRARAAQERGAPWTKHPRGEVKLEEDVGVSTASDGHLQIGRAYSTSASVDDVAVPLTLKELRETFPEALAALADSAVLAPGCRRILEESWELKPKTKDDPALPKKLDLAVWYDVTSAGQKSEKPLLVELSFKAKSDKPEGLPKADALMMKILHTIDPSWLASGGSKTEAAAACLTK